MCQRDRIWRDSAHLPCAETLLPEPAFWSEHILGLFGVASTVKTHKNLAKAPDSIFFRLVQLSIRILAKKLADHDPSDVDTEVTEQ